MLLALGFTLVVFLCLLCLFLLYIFIEEKDRRKGLERSMSLKLEVIDRICETRDKYKSDLTKERGRNKSVEVRTGFIMEKIAPFTEAFGENPKNVKHLGDPIDYVCFEDDYVCFIEVKTGKARLTTKQNKIKRLIEAGKVGFKTVRYDYE